MAEGSESVSRFFRQKATEWIEEDGSVEKHIKRVGKKGLTSEFRADPKFSAVCALVEEVGELKVRSQISRSVKGVVGNTFHSPLRGELNVIIGAVGAACGFRTVGDKLVVAGVATAAAAGIVAGILAARRMRKPRAKALSSR